MFRRQSHWCAKRRVTLFDRRALWNEWNGSSIGSEHGEFHFVKSAWKGAPENHAIPRAFLTCGLQGNVVTMALVVRGRPVHDKGETPMGRRCIINESKKVLL